MTELPTSPDLLVSNVRRAIPSDVSAVVELIHEYARELFDQAASVTPEALLRDGFGSALEFLVAEASGELVGFVAWEQTYDVVAGARGGIVLALYVRVPARGRGTGDALLAGVTNEIRAIGGTFLSPIGEDPLELSESAPPSVRTLRLRGQSTRHRAADLRRPPER
jgi:N-acetylglutamate synthase-like GNAT family acetyltransferase